MCVCSPSEPGEASFHEASSPTPEQLEEGKKNASTGMALVVVFHKKSWVLQWQAGVFLSEAMLAQGGSGDGFCPEDEGFDMGPAPDTNGVYICELDLVDDGPGDWPGSREVLPRLKSWRLATEEEWDHHLKVEWPWEPKDVWR